MTIIVGFVIIANLLPAKTMTNAEIKLAHETAAHDRDVAEITMLRRKISDYTLSHGETPQAFACRVNSTLINVEAFSYAIEKNGGTVEGALSSLSRFADKLGQTCETNTQ